MPKCEHFLGNGEASFVSFRFAKSHITSETADSAVSVIHSFFLFLTFSYLTSVLNIIQQEWDSSLLEEV